MTFFFKTLLSHCWWCNGRIYQAVANYHRPDSYAWPWHILQFHFCLSSWMRLKNISSMIPWVYTSSILSGWTDNSNSYRNRPDQREHTVSGIAIFRFFRLFRFFSEDFDWSRAGIAIFRFFFHGWIAIPGSDVAEGISLAWFSYMNSILHSRNLELRCLFPNNGEVQC